MIERHQPSRRSPSFCRLLLFIALECLWALAACGATPAPGVRYEGTAAFYSDKLHGRKTASGEPYDKNALTAAHRTLPFGTVVKVTNLTNMRSVKVRINDRGPFGDGDRIIDLSRRAAETLDMIRSGVVPVHVEIIEMPDSAPQG